MRRNLGAELRRTLDLQPVLVPVLAIVLAFASGALAILAIGSDPIEAYTSLVRGMVGSGDRIAASLGRSTPFIGAALAVACLLYTSPSPRDKRQSRMPSSA